MNNFPTQDAIAVLVKTLPSSRSKQFGPSYYVNTTLTWLMVTFLLSTTPL